MSRKVYLIPLSVFFLVVMTCGLATAASYRTIDDASAEEVVTGMSHKFVRGLANIGTGWLELPKQIYVTTKEDGGVQGGFIGPFKGIGMTLARTLAGVLEVTTFFLAYPNFYEPYFDPPYVWDLPQE